MHSDLWVQSTTCRSCNLSLAEPFLDNTKNGFDSTASSSYQATRGSVQLSYGDGSALVGNAATEVVTLGAFYALHDSVTKSQTVGQFTVQQQSFILATQQNSNFGTAGLIGLAWESIAQSGGAPWWFNALSQFQQPEMSFYFAE